MSFCDKIFSEATHLVLGLSNGKIAVELINFDNENRLSNIFVFDIAHDFGMQCPYFCFSFDCSNLIVFNANGTILCFNWNYIPAKNQIFYAYKPCVSTHHSSIEYETDSDNLTLEQQKQKEVEKREIKRIEARKAELSQTIANLKREFDIIKDRNDKLPKKFQLPLTEFDIDQRINDEMEQKAEIALKKMRDEMQKKIVAIKSRAERIEHVFLDNLEHWPITLKGFR